uniref:Oxysterol-binding protein n=1 Tax=Eptatretus burgeri TaxID=7764 RepID=A0A8C4NG91_EPTBU
ILKYGKTPMELQRGKIHGSMDIGPSVMSVKRKAGCIDLDDEENIYHLKITPPDVFDLWLSKLRQHRQHWQNKAVKTPPILHASGESEPSTPMVTTAVPVLVSIGHLTDEGQSENMVSKIEQLFFYIYIYCSPRSITESRNITDSLPLPLKVKEVMFSPLSVLRPLSGCSDDASPFRTGRRTELPALAPQHSTIALWDVLRRNVGKDLSRVTMPVELNEPLNTLQHLCEELEYSDLLDRAAETEDPVQRMVLVAAFAVSLYSCTATRASCKPFNPLLGETYECEREDRAFQFIAEQVSHHPPISACHCESKKFIFWQDIRWKNKFWGKSMEIIPIGTVHLSLPRYEDQYEWNKVTSCVHNVLVGQRWVEHYGEINIRNRADDSFRCKDSPFVHQGNYWSSSANEVQGSLIDASGHVVQRLFGKWSEGLYSGAQRSAKCIWRPGALPANQELYYGFTHFAIELNELDPNLRPFLPPTDTRFRPDQRFLEEGNLEMASRAKQHLEEMQRQRWKNMEGTYQPRFFRSSDGQEEWVTNNTYWELRKNPGFSNMENPTLW